MFEHCEILVSCGDWFLHDTKFNSLKFDHSQTKPSNRLSHVEQEGVGWMNLDDFIAPGINTGQQGTEERDAPPYEWVENFKYYAGQPLDENLKKYKQEKGMFNYIVFIIFVTKFSISP
jgi:hypothetical protein